MCRGLGLRTPSQCETVLGTVRCVLVLLLWLSLGALAPAPAWATIQRIEEAPGRVVYQTRESLKDQVGHTWQVVAFRRQWPDGAISLDLRLVGFPGTVTIDRSQPLTLASVVGPSLTATDSSGEILTSGTPLEPYVGQYDLLPILDQLRPELPWQLHLATLDGPELKITLPPLAIQDWQVLSAPDPNPDP